MVDDAAFAQAVERVTSSDWPAFSAQLASSGGCSRPVRLRGSVTSVDLGTGDVVRRFSTTGQPDGVLLKACGSRRATRCAPCSLVYKGDARVLVAAGLAGGKGVEESVASHPTVFATLTAPSFGAVHTAGAAPGPCHPERPGHCPHRRPLACWERHDPGDSIVGGAICPDCYRYEAAVVWNARVTELWRRTAIGSGRALAGLTGSTVRQFNSEHRISFVKVVEYQRRGSVHLHAILRIDRRDGEPSDVDAALLAQAVRTAAARVQAPNPLRDGEAIHWGPQAEVRVVTGAERRRVANYLAKYSTKSTDDGGALDRWVTEVSLTQLNLPEHLERLVRTALRLGDTAELAPLRMRRWAHCIGFRGHWLTKSRTYSTTFSALRRARHEYRKNQSQTGTGPEALARPFQ